MDFNDMLINLVRNYPVLYNSKDSGYKDALKKENTWTEISQKLGQSVTDCQKRWKSLRDRYSKVKKDRIEAQRSGSGAVRHKSWEHFESLSFLDDHMRHRLTVNNYEMLDLTNTSSDLEEAVMIDLEEVVNEEDVDRPRSSRQSENKEKRLEFQEKIFGLMEKNCQAISEATSKPKEDAASHFSKLVATKIRLLPEEKSDRAMAHILNYLCDLQYGNK